MDKDQEIINLKKELEKLQAENKELDRKLTDAYTINVREASLEAKKIRADLSRDFSFLYEDWSEYQTASNSPENFQVLQAIIKKAFRALERNKIKFC